MTDLVTDLMTELAALHARLQERRETVAVAESLTAGLLAAALTETPGASRSFRGGLVVYATDLKASLAGVPRPLLDAQGAVSPQVAAALADGVRKRLGATYGLALTGVAGPDEQDGKRVGTVYAAASGPSASDAAPGPGRVREVHVPGGRAEVRRGAVEAALQLLAEVIGRESGF